MVFMVQEGGHGIHMYTAPPPQLDTRQPCLETEQTPMFRAIPTRYLICALIQK